MPVYMDVHIIPGVKAKAVAEAHLKDVLLQDEHDCKCLTYWIDEERESIFCLVEAPTKSAVIEMHDRAHGLIPNKIIEVSSTLVESFLGRIYDPAIFEISDEGLKVFSDPSFRILLVTSIVDPVLLQYRLGREKTDELLERHNEIIRKNIALHGGREVEHRGSSFIGSFASAGKAVSCALAIQKETSKSDAEVTGLRIGINAGEPVGKTNNLFGDTIQLANCMCTVAKNFQVAIASPVKELISKDYFQKKNDQILTLSPQDEALLASLFSILQENCQNPDFDIPDYGKAMAMSKSQLYRKSVSLTGLSPNLLLKDFRLQKAKELMQKQRYTIAQITFDSGFTSPSYFTKCFKKKYGLLPMAYLDLLH